MIIGKVGRRGQITLPRSIRTLLNLKEGDRVAFLRQENDIVLQPLAQTLLDLRGSVPAVTGPQNFTASRQQVFEEYARKVAANEK